MQLPILYKTTKTGATQVCTISTGGDTISVEFGQLGGKMQCKYTVCKPKNLGRSNETSGEQQAELEAKSKWNKKVKSGYSVNPAAPVTVKLPQKVKSYAEHKDNIVFPAYSTYKLNGVNATYWLIDDSLKITSRGGDEYPPIPHLEETIKEYMSICGTDCLNGELYIHGEYLQDINSAVKKPKELSKKLEFWVFELPNLDIPYEDKIDLLKSIETACVPVKVDTHNCVEDHYNEAMDSGYEGTVVYHSNAVYSFNERSSDVFKYKKTKDSEFITVAWEIDKNGHVVYHCKSKGGNFKVKRKGTDKERKADAVLPSSNMGKWLTVEYETLSKSGKPLKPVGLNFRVCDDNGKPLE